MVSLLDIRTLVNDQLAMFWCLLELLPKDRGEELLEFRIMGIEKNEAGIFEKIVHQMDERSVERHSLLVSDTEEIKDFRLELSVGNLILDGCEELFNGVVEFKLSDSADVFIPCVLEIVRHFDDVVGLVKEGHRGDFFVVMVFPLEPEHRDKRVFGVGLLQLPDKLERGEGLVDGVHRPRKQSHLLSGHDRKAVIVEEKVDVGECFDAAMKVAVLESQDPGEVGAVDAPAPHGTDDSLPVVHIPEISGVELADFVIVGDVINEERGEGRAVCGKIFVVNPVHSGER